MAPGLTRRICSGTDRSTTYPGDGLLRRGLLRRGLLRRGLLRRGLLRRGLLLRGLLQRERALV